MGDGWIVRLLGLVEELAGCGAWPEVTVPAPVLLADVLEALGGDAETVAAVLGPAGWAYVCGLRGEAVRPAGPRGAARV